MKRLLVILLSIPTLAFGQSSSVVTNFGGLSGASETDLPMAIPLDIVDFDFRASGVAGAVSLVKRDGYLRVGDVQVGLTAGPWRFSSSTVSPQLLAGFGRELRLYSTSQDAWLPINFNPYSDSCSCRAGTDSVFSVYNKNWWGISTEAYTTITLGANTYNIARIMGDSLIMLSHRGAAADTLPTVTTSRVPCLINTTGTAGQSLLFTNASDQKYGIMFEDSLHIITPYEKVKYGGVAAVSITSPLSFTSISTWDRQNGAVTLSGGAGEAVGSWVQVGPTKDYDLNIALYATARTGNSNTFRVDTVAWNWLYANADSAWWYKKIAVPAFTKILSSTVSTVAKESTFVYGEVVSSSIQYVRVNQLSPGSCNTGWTGNKRLKRMVTVKKPVYLFRHKVSNTSVANAPENWQQDTLDYMVTVADNEDSAAGQKRSQGFYSRQFPVTIGPAIGAETTLVITTIGYAGGAGGLSDSTYIDSTQWAYASGDLVFCGSAVTSWTSSDSFQVSAIGGGLYRAYISYPAPPCNCAIDGNRACSLAVGCPPSAYSPIPIASNGANDCYQVGDSLFLYVMDRSTRTSLNTSVVSQDTAKGWDWGYCVSALGRFFCIDNQTRSAVGAAQKNYVYWSQPNNPDSFNVTDYDAIFTDDGQSLTTLAVEQNVVYLHKPTAIYTMPLTITPDGLSVEPTGIFPTRSEYGALSPHGLVGTPYGWFFIGFNGVYNHQGGDSEMISREIRWFWRDSLESAQIVNGAITYDSHRDRLLVAVACKGSTTNNCTLVYDFATQQWARYSFGAHHFQVLSYPTNNPQLYWADEDATDGGVFRMEEGLVTDLNDQIHPYFTTGWLTLADKPTSRSDLQEWFLQNRREASGRMELSTYVDAGTTALFTDTATSSTGGYQIDRLAFPIGINGNRFRFRLRSILGDTCEVTAFGVDYAPSGVVTPR